MNLLIAFDKFKDSMTAPAACAAAARGARRALGDQIQIEEAPLTDGGEGFCPILTTSAGGEVSTHTVTGPQGESIQAPIGWVDAAKLPAAVHALIPVTSGKIAVIEMASAAGLEQVPRDARHPNHCTSYGVGELIAIAADSGADAILLGIGGSATSDFGLGALEALGIQSIDTDGETIEKSYPSDWSRIDTFTGDLKPNIPPIYIACDVENPLLGPNGAAAIYGPQKGLKAEEIESYDAQAGLIAQRLCAHCDQPFDLKDTPGSGAAGGIGFGLKVAFSAEYVPGFDLVTAWIDLEAKVKRADCVLSGEGKIDQSSLAGKGPIALVRAAQLEGKNSLLFAGALEAGLAEALKLSYKDSQAFAISPQGMELEEALKTGSVNLENKVADILQTAE